MSGATTVHLFAGDDEYPLNEAARELVNKLMPESDQALGLEIISGRADNTDEAVTSVKRCHEAMQITGFLFSQVKVIWWRDVSFLGDNQTAQAEAVRAHVKALAGMLAGADCGGNVLVITTPKIDHRSTLFRLCQDRFEVREFMIPEKAHQAERQAREAIQAGLKTYGLRANAEVEELIFGRVGNDSRRIACELEKLAIYMGGRSSVALADVAAVVSASATAVTWDLQDAVGERNLAKAVGIVQDLLVQKESPISIAVAVASRTRELLLYRQAMERGWLRTKAGAYGREYAEWQGFSEDEKPALTLALKRPPESVHAFVAGKLMQQARHYTVTQLARNQRMVLDTQEALVSSSVPHVTAIELMLARTMGITSS